MNRSKALQKIRKLREIAARSSSNSNEAAAARAQADRLQSDHGFTEADIQPPARKGEGEQALGLISDLLKEFF